MVTLLANGSSRRIYFSQHRRTKCILPFVLFICFSSQRAWCKVFKEICHTETQASDQANGTTHIGVIKRNQMVCLKADVLWRSVLCGALSSSYTAAEKNLCAALVLLTDLHTAPRSERFRSDGFQHGLRGLSWKRATATDCDQYLHLLTTSGNSYNNRLLLVLIYIQIKLFQFIFRNR